ncbi:MAG: 30S ribosomal protein S20 [Gammaproteobacteria bacterium]
MANTSQARKRARQNVRRNSHNASLRSMLRSYIKRVLKAVEKGDKATAETAYKDVVPIIDRIADKGLLHKNKAARHKSRLNNRIRAMQ